MSTRTRIVVAVAAAMLLALGAGFTYGTQMRAEDTAAIGHIKDSYAWDVKDKRQLMSHGTHAFIAEVIGAERTEHAASTTVWRVRVVRSVKGSASGEVLVRQLGYVDKDGRAHVTEEQPLLLAGGKRLLVTTQDPGSSEHQLIAGPAASVNAPTADHELQLVRDYTAALR
jgi:hypothetical protein